MKQSNAASSCLFPPKDQWVHGPLPLFLMLHAESQGIYEIILGIWNIWMALGVDKAGNARKRKRAWNSLCPRPPKQKYLTPRYSPPLNIKPWIKSSSIRIVPSRKYSLLDLSLGFCIDSSLLFSKTFYFCTKLRTLFYTILLSPISYAIDMILIARFPAA